MGETGARGARAVDDAAGRGLDAAVLKLAEVGRPVAAAHVRRLRTRRRGRERTPADVVKRLGRQFATSAAAAGATSGAVAGARGPSLPTELAAGVAGAGAFTSAATLYVLALCEVYGIPPDDLDRRRRLLRLVVVGGDTPRGPEVVADQLPPSWSRRFRDVVPVRSLGWAETVVVPHMVTSTQRGPRLPVPGVVPAGFGAVVGAGGSAIMAQLVVHAALGALGPPPAAWPDAPPHDPA
ncbi:hypothetical protein [Cellulomonas phragmiteti]|uniref:Uncharacterized protein n=1 Tax=Cellulomonas phragmiteti TaxID=478780 RepID=A0ABQ4DRD3_9CELL|nr:hypothetical protein [Cellulomonas phragmiteti]GIG41909.1 hypothetical protein Cph01nite_36710 [Cellulomonas phragmiteti]